MFDLIERDEDTSVWEARGYRVSVIKSGKKKNMHVSLAPSENMSYKPVLTLCGDTFLINPPAVKEDKIDELLAGLSEAKAFIADFKENIDKL